MALMLLWEALLIKATQEKKLHGTDKGFFFFKCHWSVKRCVGESSFGKIGTLGKVSEQQKVLVLRAETRDRGWVPTWRLGELVHIKWDEVLSSPLTLHSGADPMEATRVKSDTDLLPWLQTGQQYLLFTQTCLRGCYLHLQLQRVRLLNYQLTYDTEVFHWKPKKSLELTV